MDDRITLRQAVLGAVRTNVYFVKNNETQEMFIVDPADDSELIKQALRSMEGNLTAILLTHGHFDHIMAVQDLKKEYDVPVYACRDEADMLRDPLKNMTGYYSDRPVSFEAEHYLDNNDIFTCAGFQVQMFHTPGHTCGSCCYYLKEEDLLFSGDTLFCGSVGRTDFPGGSMAQIVNSLHFLLDNLPDETVVCPGHESSTTIGEEKRYNPFV